MFSVFSEHEKPHRRMAKVGRHCQFLTVGLERWYGLIYEGATCPTDVHTALVYLGFPALAATQIPLTAAALANVRINLPARLRRNVLRLHAPVHATYPVAIIRV